MRLNPILFQAAALSFAASPALARSHDTKKRMAHARAVANVESQVVRVPASNLITSSSAEATESQVTRVPASNLIPSAVINAQCIPSQVVVSVDYECGPPGGGPGPVPPPATVTYTVTGQPAEQTSPPTNVTLAPGNVITKTITVGRPEQSPPPLPPITVYYTNPANGQVQPTAVSAPTGQPGSVQTIYVTLPNNQIITKTITQGVPEQSPAPTPITVYVTAPNGQVVPTAVPAPPGQPGSVQTIYVTLPNIQIVTKTITQGTPEKSPAPTPITVYYTDPSNGQVRPTAIPGPPGQPGSVQTIYVTLPNNQIITKTVTQGTPEQSPAPTPITVYITENGQVKPTAVPAPTGPPGSVQTIYVTLPNQQVITKTITVGQMDPSPTSAPPTYITVTEQGPGGGVTTQTLTLPALPDETVTVTIPQGPPITITRTLPGVSQPTTETYYPGQIITKTLPAPAVVKVYQTVSSKGLTVTNTLPNGETIYETLPPGLTITQTLPAPSPIIITETALAAQATTITRTLPGPQGQTITITVPAGQTITRTIIPKPTLGPITITRTRSPPPGPITITQTRPAPTTITQTRPGPVTTTRTRPAPITISACPPVVDLLCGNADPGKSSIEADIITGAFDIITSLSANLTDVVKTLDFFNAPAVVFQIVPGFAKIVATITADAGALGGPDVAPVGCGDADAIVIALSDFVEVHQALLGVVIGKRGLLNQIPGLQIAVLPINAVLVVLEGVVDTIAGIVIGFIPSRSCEATKKVDALRNSVIAAQQAFTF